MNHIYFLLIYVSIVNKLTSSIKLPISCLPYRMYSLYAHAFMAGIVDTQGLIALMMMTPGGRRHKASYSFENGEELEMLKFHVYFSKTPSHCGVLAQETQQPKMPGCWTPQRAWIIVKELGSKFLKQCLCFSFGVYFITKNDLIAEFDDKCMYVMIISLCVS